MGITNPFSRVRVPTSLSRTDIERTRLLREQKSTLETKIHELTEQLLFIKNSKEKKSKL